MRFETALVAIAVFIILFALERNKIIGCLLLAIVVVGLMQSCIHLG